MRRLENYVRRYGPEASPKLFHALQTREAHAGVSAWLRRKIDVLEGRVTATAKTKEPGFLPLFPDGANAACGV